MIQHTITVSLPDKEAHSHAVCGDDADLKLSEWLDRNGHSLNTRCGQKGLCRGCMVDVEAGKKQSIRACQVTMASLPEHIDRITIPERSYRDNSLNGVSVFEIDHEHLEHRQRMGYGLAIDIGTTTVAAALWDLQSGKCLATKSLANSQRRYGDNVLTRIEYAIKNNGCSKALQKTLVDDTLEPIIESLCQAAGIGPQAIVEAVASGNTAMLHAFAGVSLAGFGSYPFKPVFMDGQKWPADALGMPYSFCVESPPNLGAFVGSDIVLGALASGMHISDKPALLIDFGTNGEILLKHKNGYLATATAAGPAFEGGRLRCGAAAGSGVISTVDHVGGKWAFTLVNPEKSSIPTGISGAAYVDFIALAAEEGILYPMGRMDATHCEVKTVANDAETDRLVKLAPRISITESDVAEIIQAKAAIASGVATLLELAGLKADDLEKLYIAGGFGYHLNSAHARRIGLIPDLPHEKIHIIGNSSLGGASLLLLGKNRDVLKQLVGYCDTVELNQVDTFEDNYIDAMLLEPME